MPDHICLVQTSVGSQAQAKALADGMLAARLAACVQISAGGESHYHWQGAVEVSAEYYLAIKTRPDLEAAAIAWLQANHPYETPEIVSTELRSTPAYAAWVKRETRPA